MRLFHGTTQEAARLILKKGFKKGECSDYGNAVYFSDCQEWAAEYAHKDGLIVEALFNGNMLDLAIPEHWDIYRKTGNAIPNRFDALRDGNIIAVYNLKSLTIPK